ncbi:hypothetical protein JXI42_12780 [bacterium]|nr:hypothetical protein [bacterium]
MNGTESIVPEKKNKAKPWLVGLGIGCGVIIVIIVLVIVFAYKGCSDLVDVGKGMTISEMRLLVMNNLSDSTYMDIYDLSFDELERLNDNGKVKLSDILILSDKMEQIQADNLVTDEEIEELIKNVDKIIEDSR